jgi:hypothetical protein
MQSWICKYCNKDYLNVRLCVYHELSECKKNPKFKYTLDNTENGDKKEESKLSVLKT